MPWTWTRSAATWPPSCTRPWNRPRCRCGSGRTNDTDAGTCAPHAGAENDGYWQLHAPLQVTGPRPEQPGDTPTPVAPRPRCAAHPAADREGDEGAANSLT